MFAALATTCRRHRWIVIALWIAAAVSITVLAAGAGGEYAGGGSLNGTDSDQAYDIFRREFPNASDESAAIVFHSAEGLARSHTDIDRYLTSITSSAGLAGAASPFNETGHVSADGTTAFADIG